MLEVRNEEGDDLERRKMFKPFDPGVRWIEPRVVKIPFLLS